MTPATTTPLMHRSWQPCCFFFNDPATTEIYTLSLHDALPISTRELLRGTSVSVEWFHSDFKNLVARNNVARDRKSTRLNSSHPSISYAVFCLKKKKRPPAFS